MVSVAVGSNMAATPTDGTRDAIGPGLKKKRGKNIQGPEDIK
jgi:hypothetical protein